MADDPRRRKSEDFYFGSNENLDISHDKVRKSLVDRLLSYKFSVLALLSAIVVTPFLIYVVVDELSQRLARSDAIIAELEQRTENIRKEKNLLERLVAEQRDASSIARDQLSVYEERISSLQEQVDELSEELRTALASRPDSSEVRDIDRQVGESREDLERISNSLFQIVLVFKQVDPNIQLTIQKIIFQEMGFGKRLVTRENGTPSWLAETTTIFYYDDSPESKARERAQEIANSIQRFQARRIRIAVGAGRGFGGADRKNLLTVHVIEE